MKLLILLAAAICAVPLAAQDVPDLVEIEAPALADSAWQDLTGELRRFAQPLRLGGRLYLSENSSRSDLNLLYQLERASLLISQRRDWESGSNHWNGSLLLDSDRLSLRLGSQNLRFGRGIVLGSGSRALTDSLFSAKNPPSPASYSPLGVSASFRQGHWRGSAFASLQQREAYLDNGEITSLPQTRDNRFNSVQESIAGLAGGYQSKALRAGLLFYWQQYDRPFADPGLKDKLWAASAFAGFRLPANRFDAEFALAGGEPCWLASWQLRLGPFSQTVSHARNAADGQLPYAIHAGILDHTTISDEANFDVSIKLPLRTSLSLRYALNSASASFIDNLSRLIVSAEYRDSLNSVRFSFSKFDGEILPDYIPMVSDIIMNGSKYRFELATTHKSRNRFTHEIKFRYSEQDVVRVLKRMYYFRIATSYKHGLIDLKAGFSSWQSPVSFIVEDELSPEYYSVYGADDTSAFLSASGGGKGWNFSLSAAKSLFRAKDFSLNLRGSLSLF